MYLQKQQDFNRIKWNGIEICYMVRLIVAQLC